MRDEQLRKEGPPDTFDNTMLTVYNKCPREEYWFLRGASYKRTPSYFVWGRAWGAAMNSWHSSEEEDIEIRKTKALLAARKVWEAEPIEIFENRPNDSWENLESTFAYYVNTYGPTEFWKQLSSRGELGFRFPIPNTLLFYAGALDDYIEWKPYGILGREDKAPGDYITQSYLNQWSHVSQISGYLWALHQLVEKPFGILMNIASKRPRKDPLLRFSRNLQSRSEWRIVEFMKHTVVLCDRFRKEWAKWEWPKLGERDPYACAGGPGKSPCIYRSLCLQEVEPWELEEKYNFEEQFSWRVGKWTPWERKGEEVNGKERSREEDQSQSNT